MDTSLAAWLLNPDLIPSRSFAELLNSFEVKPPPPKQVCPVSSQTNVMLFS